MKPRRSVVGASSGRGRSDRTIEDAKALVPELIMRLLSSLRIGHVEVMAQPERIMPSSSVSQPEDASPVVLLSLCLNA